MRKRTCKAQGDRTKKNILAKTKGYQTLIARGKCVSVIPHIKTHTSERIKWCVNLRLGMENKYAG